MPRVVARNSAPGSHQFLVTKVRYDYGRFGDNPQFLNPHNYDYLEEVSTKPFPLQGDHKSDYNYGIRILKVEEDTLFVVHEYDGPVQSDGTNRNWDYRKQGSITQVIQPFAYGVSFTGEDESNAEIQSQQQALQDLQSNNAQVGVDLAEASKTSKMLSQSVTALAKSILAAKRGQWSKIPVFLGLKKKDILTGKYPANKFLEYQYGWKPMMQGAFEAANVLMSDQSVGKNIRGRGRGSYDVTHTGSSHGVDYTVRRYGSYHTTLKASVFIPGLAKLQGLGLANPLSIAWELVPFSFVIDWFIPVGQVLGNLSASLGLISRGGWTSCHQYYEIVAHMRPSEPQGTEAGTVLEDLGTYREVGYSFSRRAFANFPFPEFYAKTPNKALSPTHIANAVALARSIVR